jgi:hypothetical protein
MKILHSKIAEKTTVLTAQASFCPLPTVDEDCETEKVILLLEPIAAVFIFMYSIL